METAFADLFQLDHITITMHRDDVASIEERLSDLRRIMPIAERATTHGESSSWNALCLGNSGGYVEIFEAESDPRPSFAISMRSRKKGALDRLKGAFEARSVAHTLYKERLHRGEESMDWFRCVESVIDRTGVPLFFNEYCKEFLEDCGLTEETMDRLGRPEDAAVPYGFVSVTARIERPNDGLLSILDPRWVGGERSGRGFAFRLGDGRACIVESAASAGLSEVTIPIAGVLERAVRTVGGWVLYGVEDTLTIRREDRRTA